MLLKIMKIYGMCNIPTNIFTKLFINDFIDAPRALLFFVKNCFFQIPKTLLYIPREC